MRVLYHLTILPPKIPQAEALSQEIEALRREFGGELNTLNPNDQSPVYLPRLLFGLPQLARLRQMEIAVQLHHVYNPDPFPFPVLRWLKRPVVYSITSGVGTKKPNVAYFNRLAAIVVPDERSLTRLQRWGMRNVHLIRAGIDTARFRYAPATAGGEFRVLAASAPWTTGQFASKGIDALLAAAQQNPALRLVFLWRDVLLKEMLQRVQQAKLADRVTVINGLADVNTQLGQIHATIALASQPGIVKSYPHSLLDSLAAGKPVLVSRAIPMADYVEANGCGAVVEKVTPEAILAAIDKLAANYPAAQKATGPARDDFAMVGMIESYRKVYQQIQEITL